MLKLQIFHERGHDRIIDRAGVFRVQNYFREHVYFFNTRSIFD